MEIYNSYVFSDDSLSRIYKYINGGIAEDGGEWTSNQLVELLDDACVKLSSYYNIPVSNSGELLIEEIDEISNIVSVIS